MLQVNNFANATSAVVSGLLHLPQLLNPHYIVHNYYILELGFDWGSSLVHVLSLSICHVFGISLELAKEMTIAFLAHKIQTAIAYFLMPSLKYILSIFREYLVIDKSYYNDFIDNLKEQYEVMQKRGDSEIFVELWYKWSIFNFWSSLVLQSIKSWLNAITKKP